MTDSEISKALALVIGWPEVKVFSWGVMVREVHGAVWRNFDHCDWKIIGPIAELHDCFPKYINCSWEIAHYGEIYRANKPQNSIALAVIGSSI